MSGLPSLPPHRVQFLNSQGVGRGATRTCQGTVWTVLHPVNYRLGPWSSSPLPTCLSARNFPVLCRCFLQKVTASL